MATTYKSSYTHPELPAIVVMYPEKAEPFVPQSCYAFGAPKLIDVCRAINEASIAIADALREAMPDGTGGVLAALTGNELVDDLVRGMGFELVATERVR